MNGLRGLRTLGVRLRQQTENAQRVAEVLEGHPACWRVSYPGLESHPQHDLAKRQMTLPGGLLTFDLAGGLEAGRSFVESTRVAQLATSLGGPETLVTHPASTTHVNLTPEELALNGILPGTIRVSMGLEHPDDLVADFLQALEPAAREPWHTPAGSCDRSFGPHFPSGAGRNGPIGRSWSAPVAGPTSTPSTGTARRAACRTCRAAATRGSGRPSATPGRPSPPGWPLEGERPCPRCRSGLRTRDHYCRSCGLDVSRLAPPPPISRTGGVWMTPGPLTVDAYQPLGRLSIVMRVLVLAAHPRGRRHRRRQPAAVAYRSPSGSLLTAGLPTVDADWVVLDQWVHRLAMAQAGLLVVVGAADRGLDPPGLPQPRLPRGDGSAPRSVLGDLRLADPRA